MAQMASLLVVATVFVSLWTLNIYILQSERGGGLYTRQNYLCRNLSQNCRGGLYARGGVFAGFYGTCKKGGHRPRNRPLKVCWVQSKRN